MNRNSRTYKAINNVKFAIVCQILYFVFSFICRTVFIRFLGAEYLGINGLFGNILTLLSLTELGFEETLIYRMYKPIAMNDQAKLKTLIDFCRKMFWIVSSIVIVIGLALIPFLKYLVQAPKIKESIILLYVLFLANSLTNFIFVYRYTILLADQKNYIITIFRLIFNIILNLSQIFALFITHNYIVYLMLLIICNLLNNIFCSRKAVRDYPFLKEKDIKPITREEKKSLWIDIKGTGLQKTASQIFQQTDYIMISILLGIKYIGYVSNYLILINIINGAIGQVIGSISASVGNLHVLEGEDKKLAAFKKVYFINSYIYGFASVGFLLLLNEFVGKIWLSPEYMLTAGVSAALIVRFYINGVHFSAHIFRKSMGYFSQFKYVPLLAAISNILLEIILFNKYGLIGIFAAPILTRSLIVEPVDIYVIYKNGFRKSLLDYYIRHLGFAALYFFLYLVSGFVISFIDAAGLPGFLIKILITAVIFNGAIILLFYRTKMFKELLNMVKTNLLKHREKVMLARR